MEVEKDGQLEMLPFFMKCCPFYEMLPFFKKEFFGRLPGACKYGTDGISKARELWKLRHWVMKKAQHGVIFHKGFTCEEHKNWLLGIDDF